MSTIKTLLASLSLALAATTLAVPALAEQQLREYEGAPFTVGAQQQIDVRVLPQSSSATLDFAGVLPAAATGLDVLDIKWQKGKRSCELAVAQTGGLQGNAQEMLRSYLAVKTADGAAQVVKLDSELTQGFLTRLCIWPLGQGDAAELVVLASISASWEDSRILGFTLNGAGQTTLLDTGGAASLFGWFDCIDLDDDGSFELVTSRNLDGTLGGFYYHSVRSLDAAKRGFVADPERYKPYFQRELDWLNWVVDTRAKIQADPAAYLSKTDTGPAYQAMYEKRNYAFDSLIELPATYTNIKDLETYNRERREAFERVRRYRDELSAWLAGGARPATWNLP